MATKRNNDGTFKKGHTGAGKPGRKKGSSKTGGRKKGTNNKAVEIRQNVEAVSDGLNREQVNQAFDKALSAENVDQFNANYERLHKEGSPMELLAHQLVARALRKEQAAANYLLKHVIGDPLDIKQREKAKEQLRSALEEIQPDIKAGDITLAQLQDWEVRHRPYFIDNENAERIFNDTVNSIRAWVTLHQQNKRLENEAMFREQSLIIAQQTKMTRKQMAAWVELNYELIERFANDPEKAAAYLQDRLANIIPEFIAPETHDPKQMIEAMIMEDEQEGGK